MPKFGPRSTKNLSEAHPLLQELFNEVIKHYDCAVIEGHRPKEEQDKAFHGGKSRVQWPNSKHNKQPSLAVDVCPYPIDWNDTKRFYYFAGKVIATAELMGIDVRWGGDWDSDNDFRDQTFNDLPHFELRSTTKQGRDPSNNVGQPARDNHLPDGPSETDINDALEGIEEELGI